MNNFFQFLLHFIFIATFLFVYIIAIIILKPFRLHRKRKISTVSLKLSYLIYLAFFLAFVYLVLFFADNEVNTEESMENGTSTIYYIIVLVSFFIPNIGIMIRRRLILRMRLRDISSRNSSELNLTRRMRRRLSRWMMTGITPATSPARKTLFRKLNPSMMCA